MTSRTEQRITAVDVVHPAAGEVVEVVDGEVLVFALDAAQRRLPLATVTAGGVVAGCEPTAGCRLLATGLPGTVVRRGPLDDGVDRAALLAWAARLGDAAAGGRWPARLIAVAEAGAMVAPGQHIGGGAALQWLRLTGGAATFCGVPGASVGPLDPALPLPRGTWLDAGLRCRVRPVDAPADAADWAAALDLLGRLAMTAALVRREARDRAVVTRLEDRRRESDRASAEAVDALADAVGGEPLVPYVSDERRGAELAAATEVARAAGLVVDDDALERVAADVDSGREPVAALAAACGGRARTVVLRPGWWRREGRPLLVRLEPADGGPDRPGAATWRRGGWHVAEPAEGRETLVDAAVAPRVRPDAVELVAVLPARPTGLADLARLALRGSGGELAVVAGVTAMLAALSFATPFLMGQIAGLFSTSSATAAFVGLFGALLLVVLAGAAWQSVRALALLRARSQAAAVSAGALWERIMRLPSSWHSAHRLGDRSAQAGAVNNASAALPDETVARLLDTATILGSLAAVATTSGAMVAGVALVILLQLAVTFSLLRAVQRRAEQRIDAAAAATGRLVEILRAVNRLRVAGAESRAFLRWAQVQARFSRADQELRRITMAQGVVIAVWPTLALVVVVVVTTATGASFADFVTAQTAATAATTAVAAMALAANGTLIGRQSLRKAVPLLEAVPEGGADGVQPGALQGGIEVRDLVFRYGPDLPPVLDHVSLRVQPGEHVAVVGPSGCGKTTLMRVLLGLEEPESGVITVDGRDLASLDRPAVRRQIGSVLQSSSLLPGTIKDNVDMGRGMRQDEIWAALDAAAVADDVRALAMKMDTPVTDGGGTVSGGQRQRILIARALAGSPRMLVLDEATSALDNLTQAAVVEALEGLRITRIVVAHRLSTIRTADRVIVMSDGRIIDEGTYDELVGRPGVFRDLAERQQA